MAAVSLAGQIVRSKLGVQIQDTILAGIHVVLIAQ